MSDLKLWSRQKRPQASKWSPFSSSPSDDLLFDENTPKSKRSKLASASKKLGSSVKKCVKNVGKVAFHTASKTLPSAKLPFKKRRQSTPAKLERPSTPFLPLESPTNVHKSVAVLEFDNRPSPSPTKASKPAPGLSPADFARPTSPCTDLVPYRSPLDLLKSPTAQESDKKPSPVPLNKESEQENDPPSSALTVWETRESLSFLDHPASGNRRRTYGRGDSLDPRPFLQELEEAEPATDDTTPRVHNLSSKKHQQHRSSMSSLDNLVDLSRDEPVEEERDDSSALRPSKKRLAVSFRDVHDGHAAPIASLPPTFKTPLTDPPVWKKPRKVYGQSKQATATVVEFSVKSNQVFFAAELISSDKVWQVTDLIDDQGGFTSRLYELGAVKHGKWTASIHKTKSTSPLRLGALHPELLGLSGVRLCLRSDQWSLDEYPTVLEHDQDGLELQTWDPSTRRVTDVRIQQGDEMEEVDVTLRALSIVALDSFSDVEEHNTMAGATAWKVLHATASEHHRQQRDQNWIPPDLFSAAPFDGVSLWNRKLPTDYKLVLARNPTTRELVAVDVLISTPSSFLGDDSPVLSPGRPMNTPIPLTAQALAKFHEDTVTPMSDGIRSDVAVDMSRMEDPDETPASKRCDGASPSPVVKPKSKASNKTLGNSTLSHDGPSPSIAVPKTAGANYSDRTLVTTTKLEMVMPDVKPVTDKHSSTHQLAVEPQMELVSGSERALSTAMDYPDAALREQESIAGKRSSTHQLAHGGSPATTAGPEMKLVSVSERTLSTSLGGPEMALREQESIAAKPSSRNPADRKLCLSTRVDKSKHKSGAQGLSNEIKQVSFLEAVQGATMVDPKIELVHGAKDAARNLATNKAVAQEIVPPTGTVTVICLENDGKLASTAFVNKNKMDDSVTELRKHVLKPLPSLEVAQAPAFAEHKMKSDDEFKLEDDDDTWSLQLANELAHTPLPSPNSRVGADVGPMLEETALLGDTRLREEIAANHWRLKNATLVCLASVLASGLVLGPVSPLLALVSLFLSGYVAFLLLLVMAARLNMLLYRTGFKWRINKATSASLTVALLLSVASVPTCFCTAFRSLLLASTIVVIMNTVADGLGPLLVELP